MIDIKFIRENPELVKKNIKKKLKDEKLHFVDEAIKLDEKWRKLKYEEDGFMAGYEAGIEFREEDEEDDNLEWGVDDHEGGLT